MQKKISRRHNQWKNKKSKQIRLHQYCRRCEYNRQVKNYKKAEEKKYIFTL